MLKIISSYLHNRKVRVRVDGCLSDASPPDYINSSVPQGSILGPLLFFNPLDLWSNGLLRSVFVRPSVCRRISVFLGSFRYVLSYHLELWYVDVSTLDTSAHQKFCRSDSRWPIGGHLC